MNPSNERASGRRSSRLAHVAKQARIKEQQEKEEKRDARMLAKEKYIQRCHSRPNCNHEWNGEDIQEHDLMRVGNNSIDVCVRCHTMQIWFVNPITHKRESPPLAVFLNEHEGFRTGEQYSVVGTNVEGTCVNWRHSAAVLYDERDSAISVTNDPLTSHNTKENIEEFALF